VRECAY